MAGKVTATERARDYSNKVIQELRVELNNILVSNEILVVAVGSFARREASDQSDVDYYVIYTGGESVAEGEKEKVAELLRKKKLKFPSEDGAFDDLQKYDDLLKNIGGNHDGNKQLTRRMLILLESEWLYNEDLYESLFNDMIVRYVSDNITDHQMCRFLLNDLIRYYRTMCVDFEYKVHEAKKPWGERNIKLVFSRKMLYFSVLITIAETVQHTAKEKRNKLKSYLRKTPLERVIDICGNRSRKALEFYDHFLEKLADAEIRKMLRETGPGDDALPGDDEPPRKKEDFRQFKNEGHHFSWELCRLLEVTYDSTHPIHHAIKF